MYEGGEFGGESGSSSLPVFSGRKEQVKGISTFLLIVVVIKFYRLLQAFISFYKFL